MKKTYHSQPCPFHTKCNQYVGPKQVLCSHHWDMVPEGTKEAVRAVKGDVKALAPLKERAIAEVSAMLAPQDPNY